MQYTSCLLNFLSIYGYCAFQIGRHIRMMQFSWSRDLSTLSMIQLIFGCLMMTLVYWSSTCIKGSWHVQIRTTFQRPHAVIWFIKNLKNLSGPTPFHADHLQNTMPRASVKIGEGTIVEAIWQFWLHITAWRLDRYKNFYKIVQQAGDQ